MGSDDLTIRVLTEIRDGVRETNERVRETNEKVDHLAERVDKLDNRMGKVEQGLDTMGRRIVESEMRVATEIVALHGTMRDIHGMLKSQLDLRDRVAQCERDIDDLKKRVN